MVHFGGLFVAVHLVLAVVHFGGLFNPVRFMLTLDRSRLPAHAREGTLDVRLGINQKLARDDDRFARGQAAADRNAIAGFDAELDGPQMKN